MEENNAIKEPLDSIPSENNNTQGLLNLIESIQTKLNYDNNQQNSSTIENNVKENSSNNFDISSIFNMLGNKSSKDEENSDNSSFDQGSMLKMLNLFSKINKEDPKKNLLMSLKPFLRKSRQDKMSEYMTILTILNALEIFEKKGSDEDV